MTFALAILITTTVGVASCGGDSSGEGAMTSTSTSSTSLTLGFPDGFDPDVSVQLEPGLSRSEILTVGVKISELDGVAEAQADVGASMILVALAPGADFVDLRTEMLSVDGVVEASKN